MSAVRFTSSKFRILCFDIENKPGTFGPGDYTHAKVTAIGAQWLDGKKVRSWCLDRTNIPLMRQHATEFAAMWNEAGAVMGHYIRGHDIKILNGMMQALDLPLLPAKRPIDTMKDTPKVVGLSRSLENLCARWGCPLEKVNMTEWDWERAYDGIPAGVKKMRLRVETDVRMNVWLYHDADAM